MIVGTLWAGAIGWNRSSDIMGVSNCVSRIYVRSTRIKDTNLRGHGEVCWFITMPFQSRRPEGPLPTSDTGHKCEQGGSSFRVGFRALIHSKSKVA